MTTTNPMLAKRSACLLKYKPFESDEASVIGYEGGEGRLAGMIGALIVRWKDKVFNVGAGIPDAIRMAPPALGAAITFGFCGLTDGGLPRFPTFVAERNYEQWTNAPHPLPNADRHAGRWFFQ